MKVLLFIAFLINVFIIVCEISTLSKVKKKIDILKYYTYLQNLLCLIVSIIFSIYLGLNIIFDVSIPEVVGGFRYIVAVGLVVTMFIYVLVLRGNSKNVMNEDDFVSGYDPRKANMILHYVCPLLSLLSFVLFERSILLNEPYWTIVVAIPSCLYWIIYGVLSATKLWKEPYDFSSNNKNKVLDVLIVLSIPISFILISIIVWNLR